MVFRGRFVTFPALAVPRAASGPRFWAGLLKRRETFYVSKGYLGAEHVFVQSKVIWAPGTCSCTAASAVLSTCGEDFDCLLGA